jgi:hypothetical protein
MRYFGNLNTPVYPAIPDTVLSLQLTAATGQAFDYPAGCDLVRVSMGSSVAGQGVVYFNGGSTGAVLPTTLGVIAGTTLTTGHNVPITQGMAQTWQRPRGTTGFSVIAPSSFQVCVEFWSRAGTT